MLSLICEECALCSWLLGALILKCFFVPPFSPLASGEFMQLLADARYLEKKLDDDGVMMFQPVILSVTKCTTFAKCFTCVIHPF